jgi:hypothetical protein
MHEETESERGRMTSPGMSGCETVCFPPHNPTANHQHGSNSWMLIQMQNVNYENGGKEGSKLLTHIPPHPTPTSPQVLAWEWQNCELICSDHMDSDQSICPRHW